MIVMLDPGSRLGRLIALATGKVRGPVQRQKGLRDARRAAGLCPRCGSEPQQGFTMCGECLYEAKLLRVK